MSRFDPRAWSMQRPLTTVLLFFSMSAVLTWGNLRVEKGGILDSDVILQPDDPFRVMDRYVKDKAPEGFEGREFIPFVINTSNHPGPDAEKILQVTRAAQKAFGETVLSLATAPAYRDTGESLLDEPYVTKRNQTFSETQANEWRQRLAHDASVFGLLIGRDSSWASVVRYLPPGYDEIHEFRRTTEFVEGRSIPWWEWLWKKDIQPTEAWLGVSGWTMGRGLIDQGLNVDILTFVFLGVALTFPIFWATLGSCRAAVLGVGIMIVGGFIGTRGAMGLLGVPERVYSLLAYASVIVQGASFALHKFSAFKEAGDEDRRQRWLRARSVDGLIATTAGISAFGFATLWSFGLKPMRELGVSATIGVGWLLFLAMCVLPAFDIVTASRTASGRSSKTESTHAAKRRTFGLSLFSRWGRRMTTLLEAWAVRGQSAAIWCTVGQRPLAVIAGTCGMFVVVVVLFFQGAIPSYTRALEFIQGTLVEREARFLNQPGNVGFEFLDLLVEPTQGGGITNPHFLARAWELQTMLKTIPGSRETTSILGTLHQIAQESFKKALPETDEEVAAAFFLMESRLAPAIQRQLYFPGGVRISVSYGTDDSVELGRFRDAILALAHRSFSDLKVNTFNKVPLYPQVDQYVRAGKVSNVFVSQIGIAILCALIIGWRNRRLPHARLSPVLGGLAMSLPLLFATTVMGLTMWCFRIPLDMATAPIGALAINAATDFSLYLALVYQNSLSDHAPLPALRQSLQVEGKVILADCVLNTCCFLPLISSHFLPVRQLGWMMGLMLVACAIGSLVLMAALLPSCVKRKELRYGEALAPVRDSARSFLAFFPGSGRVDRASNRSVSASAVVAPR
jgi:predicted RND superfamily exporter protein